MEKVFYLDDKDNIVDKDKATHFYIHTYDDNGVLLEKEHYSLSKDNNNTENDIVLTTEEEELFNNIKNDKGEYPFRKK